MILTIKLDRFVEGPESFHPIRARLFGFLLQITQPATAPLSLTQDTFIFFQLTGARIEMDQPCAIFFGLIFGPRSRIRAAAE